MTGGTDAVAPQPTGNWSLANPAVTLYTYNTLDNLTCVEQHGGVSGTGCSSAPSSDSTSPWRVRRFTYNSLSQLTAATNPESGTINYSYNDDGVLISKTDARGITITYSPADGPIDVLHRVTKKTYSNGDPAVTYSYDSSGVTNGIGRRTGMSDASGSVVWGYDALGRETLETRTIAGITKNIGHTYNFDSSVATITYPSGEVITYTPSAAGRTLSAMDLALGINYAGAVGSATYPAGANAAYAPHGALSGVKYGVTGSFAGVTTTNSYNKRLQPVFLSAASPTQTIFSLGYGFGLGAADNGNVSQITNNLDGTRSQSFTYDGLNRLLTAQTTSSNNWGDAYVYDAWGNLLQKNPTKGSAETFTASANWQNRLVGYGYDSAGNMTTGVTGYDGESRITSTGGVTYTYDGEGTRVKKSNGTLYWGTGPLAESDLAGVITKEFVFFNGQRTAMRKSSGEVDYYFADHLGTSRVLTNATGTALDDQDFFPFGGTASGSSASGNNYKFTGKERDTESTLDYFGARHYSSAMGRWMSPDWAATPQTVPYADFGDPQTLNQYSYVRNNPLWRADIDGHNWFTDLWQKTTNWAKYGEFVSDADLEDALQVKAQYYRDMLLGEHVSVNGQQLNADSFKGLSNQQIVDMGLDYGEALRRGQVGSSAAGVAGLTQWGWQGQQKYNEAKNLLNKPNTPEGNVDRRDLLGKVPTKDEAVRMIQDAGGKVERIEEGHAPGGVSTHSSPHINYTTASGAKGTIDIRQ